MQTRPLKVDGAWEFTPRSFTDDRGFFLEWFKADVFVETVGHPLTFAQANHSSSAAGVLRGVHSAKVPPGQGKYVYCPKGSVLDVVVDIRVGSPTFGTWDSVVLDSRDRRAVYISEGLGHAFLGLEDDSNITYLCSTRYTPEAEFGIHPLDPELQLPWPADLTPILSKKDAEAPSLSEAAELGLLPTYAECQQFYAELGR
ncbi:dTDP-4-dehydrorhamnose 3,5-epimerase [Frankineae bacterium MT45]|nr:dTDP-4-dehydrorhamnose 3,5-epimerase [Frankineae bacterium MT45]